VKAPTNDWHNSTASGATTNTVSPTLTASSVRGYKWRCKISNQNGYVYTNEVTNAPKYDIAKPFNNATNFPVGAYCTYAGILYRCTTAHTGEWDASHFTAVEVGNDLTVLNSAQLPVITKQPEDVYGSIGDTISFTVEATGVGTLTYLWQYKLRGSSTWYNASDQTSSTVSFSIANANIGEKVRCKITNANGTIYSNEAAVNPESRFALPVITKQPEDVYVAVGSPYSFSVEATGFGTLTYQWEYRWRNHATWTNISGATSATYSDSGLTDAEIGAQARCKITNTNGTVYSNVATINPEFNFAPQFDPNTPVPYGSYVVYNTGLYRCTNPSGHPVSAWVNADFTAVSVGGDIVNYLPTLFAPAGFGLGGRGFVLNSSFNFDASVPEEGAITKSGFYSWSSSSVPSGLPSYFSSKNGVALFIGASSVGSLIIAAALGGSGDSYVPRIAVRQKWAQTASSWHEITLT